MRAIALLVAAPIALGAAVGCGEEDEFAGSPDPASERNDPPAKPPPGWHTFANRRAGFTVSVPPGWATQARKSASLIRSGDRLLAVTVAADRSEAGRTTGPRQYAKRAFTALPGFMKLKQRTLRRVARSPYPSARIDGDGILADRRQRQLITVAAFRRPDRVTYTVVAFSAPAGRAYAGDLAQLLASLRARRPAL